MHREDRLRARRYARGDIVGVEVHRRRIDVGEDRRRSSAGNCLRRRVEGEGRADDLVARADAERVEDEHERVRAVGDADRLANAQVGGRLTLESGHVRPEDELGALEHALDRLANPRQERLVLRFYVNQRDRTHGQQV